MDKEYEICYEGRPELPIRFQAGTLVNRVGDRSAVPYRVSEICLEDDELLYILADGSRVRAREISRITDGSEIIMVL